MRYYAVAQLDVTDPSWVRDYVSEVTPMVERRGGRYLARSAGARSEFLLVAGEDVNGVARIPD
jgi:uncharacterized protein (DUF1330 family)